jgi:hypothetical protein
MWNFCFVVPVTVGTKVTVGKGLKISGNNTRSTLNILSTKNRCTWNITHYEESATMILVA